MNLGQHFQVILQKFAVIPLQFPKHFLVNPNKLAFRYCPSRAACSITVMFAADPYRAALYTAMIECRTTITAIQQIGEQMAQALLSTELIRFLFQQDLCLFKYIPRDDGRMRIGKMVLWAFTSVG